jgi:hypothetical protein
MVSIRAVSPLRRLSVVSGGPTSSPKQTDSHGVSLPPRVFRQWRHRVYRVNASPSLSLFTGRAPKHPGQTDSEVFTPLTLPGSNESARKSSHRLWLPYRVSPTQHRKLSVPSAQAPDETFHLLLPRFFPLQRFASHGEPHNPVSPTPSG